MKTPLEITKKHNELLQQKAALDKEIAVMETPPNSQHKLIAKTYERNAITAQLEILNWILSA